MEPPSPPARLARAIARIDEANDADPNVLVVDGARRPKERVHGERVVQIRGGGPGDSGVRGRGDRLLDHHARIRNVRRPASVAIDAAEHLEREHRECEHEDGHREQQLLL
ncbi:MAG: hypothetical protein KC466_04320, partial [Myxococcales bacterium]|nr:hypothetical protein [Myxococcales bacterium]